LLTTQAIIIKEVNYRDNDKMLTFFSPELGRIDALSRGCRKSTGKLLAASQLFVCGEFQFSSAKGKLYLAGCEINHTFYHLRDDYQKLFIAQYFLEAIGISILPGQADKPLYFLLINALYALENGMGTPENTILFFQLKCAEAIGFRPDLSGCTTCGNETADYLGVENGGMVCGACMGQSVGQKLRLTPEEKNIMLRMLDAPTKALREKTSYVPSIKLRDFMNTYIEQKTDHRFKSYQMLKID